MSGRHTTFKISGTTPAVASQAVIGKPVGGLEEYDHFWVYAELIGATGGVLDVYLQRKLEDDVWVDWVHFTQLTAGNAAVKWALSTTEGVASAPVAVGKSGNAGTGGGDGAPALAANAIAPGHPGDTVRAVAVAGASTSAGAAIVIRIKGMRANW